MSFRKVKPAGTSQHKNSLLPNATRTRITTHLPARVRSFQGSCGSYAIGIPACTRWCEERAYKCWLGFPPAERYTARAELCERMLS